MDEDLEIITESPQVIHTNIAAYFREIKICVLALSSTGASPCVLQKQECTKHFNILDISTLELN